MPFQSFTTSIVTIKCLFHKDELSDLSLDSGVNLYFTPSPPTCRSTNKDDIVIPSVNAGKCASALGKNAGTRSNGSDAASSCEDESSDDEVVNIVDVSNSSDKLDDEFSDDDNNLNNCFVSYQFDDYPDSVFLVSEDKLENTRKNRLRRSSVLNPEEVYMLRSYAPASDGLEDQVDLGNGAVKRSRSIKSRF